MKALTLLDKRRETRLKTNIFGHSILLAMLLLLFTACNNQTNLTSGEPNQEQKAESRLNTDLHLFTNASVHDPSVIKVNSSFYVFGSHLAAAKSTDLMQWQKVADGVNESNPLFENVVEELKETFDWAESDTLWAADVTQLEDGRFYMYYTLVRVTLPALH